MAVMYTLMCAVMLASVMCTHAGNPRQCLNQHNMPVDWFIVYKLPRDTRSLDPLTQLGLGYVYMDADSSSSWTRGDVSLNNTQQAIGFTLQQVYNTYTSHDAMYMFYNDETPPKDVSYSHGHTKGVVAFDDESGFWLVHSLPRFPDYTNTSYSYPHSGLNYGQTFLCMSLHYRTALPAIAHLLYFSYPQIYDSFLPEKMAHDIPEMRHVMVNGSHATGAPHNASLTLTTLGGATFRAFAKSKEFAADLYDGWLAPHYRTDLYAETWQNGRGKLNASCSRSYKVYNVHEVRIAGGLDNFTETKDHSKWAVSAEPDPGVCCIGDINRAVSQEGRSGGTVCLQHPDVWDKFRRSVFKADTCKEASSHKFDWSDNQSENSVLKYHNMHGGGKSQLP